MIVHVKGGTNAGKRSLRQAPDWYCNCAQYGARGFEGHRVHPGHRYSCPDCGARRP